MLELKNEQKLRIPYFFCGVSGTIASTLQQQHSIQQPPSISIMHKFNTYHSISGSINHQTTSFVSLHRRKSSFPSWKGSVLQTKLYGVESESWKSQCVRTS